jgi:ribose 5-phosphate isomerase
LALQDSIQKLAKEAVKLVSGAKVVGLGSGNTAGFIVREMAKLPGKESIEFVPTSLQIKLEAEKSSLTRPSLSSRSAGPCQSKYTQWHAH